MNNRILVGILCCCFFCMEVCGNNGLGRQGKELISIKDKHSKSKELNVFAGVKGLVSRDKMQEVGLYEVVDGGEALISKTRVGKNGWYGFAVEISAPGFYTVGGEKTSERIRIYLEAGTNAEVNILEDTLVITSHNSPENLLLAQWEGLFEPVRRRVDHMDYIFFTYKELFPWYMDFLSEAEAFKTKIRSRNTAFKALLKQTIDYDVEYFALRALAALKLDRVERKGCRPTVEEYPEYYRRLVTKDKLKDASLLEQPYGVDYLERYVKLALQFENRKVTIADELTWLPCDLLKAEIVLLQAGRAKTYEKYDEVVTYFARYLTTESHHRRMGELSAKLYVGHKGGKAANFTYPDRNGKMVSLSDFKGKIVVVDVWATWCGPCRKEIPALIELEKEMHGKDVVFIGVSVDEKKDYQKWLEALDKEGLEGVQLFANGWSQIVKDYKIKGIPRFMVFDREGNVISIDAPRPSEPKLKALLERELTKGQVAETYKPVSRK